MIFASLVLLVMSASVPKSYAGDKLTSASFDSVKIYYGKGKMSIHNTGGLYVTVLTPNEAAYGVYNDAIRKNEQASVISWTGSGPAPVLILTDYGNADSSNCPGINTATFQCAYETFKITVQSDSYGCPWLASFIRSQINPDSGDILGQRTMPQYVRRSLSRRMTSRGVRITSATIRRYSCNPMARQSPPRFRPT